MSNATGSAKQAGYLPSFAVRYLGAAALVAATLFVRIQLDAYADHRPLLIFFFLPILLSAFIGGSGPGFLATAMSTLGACIFLRGPGGGLRLENPADTFQLLLLAAVGGLLSWLVENFRRSARLRAEAEAEARLKGNLDDMIEGCQVIGPDWRYLYLNREAVRQSRKTEAELIGNRIMDVYPGIEHTPLFADLMRCMADKTTAVIESKFAYPGGMERWFELRIQPVPEGLFILSLDITERKNVAAAAAERDALLEIVTDSSKVGLVIVDARFCYRYANRAYIKIMNLPSADIIGKCCADVLAPVFATQIRPRLERALAGENVSYELVIADPNTPGESRFYNVIYTPQRQNQEALVVAVVVDITELKRAQEAIQSERNQLRTLIDVLPDQVYIKDLESRFVIVNNALAKALGRHPLEIIGRSDEDFFPPELAAHQRATEAGVLAGQPLLNDEATVQTPVGQTLTLLTTKKPLRNERDEVYGLVGIARNITEHKQAVKVVLESEQRMRALFELSPDAILVEDLEGKILDANTAAARLHGLSRGALIGRSIHELVPEDRREAVQADFARLVAGNHNKATEGVSLTADGRQVPVEITTSRITYSGKPALLVNARDITERKASETEARRRDEHFRMLIENASDIITVISPEGVIQFQSPSVRRILGYRPEEMTGRSGFEFIRPEDAQSVLTAIRKAVAQPEAIITAEYQFRHQNGSWRTLQSSGRYQATGPTAGSIVLNSRDVSESRILEEQLRQAQKMEAIGILAGGVAHDFNNILTIIRGNASLLQPPGANPAEQDECVQQIIHATDRAAGLTRQLLLFSRKQVLQPADLELNRLVSDTVKMLRRFLGEDITLETDFAPQLPFIRADAGMIDQVLINLAVNARDAMPRGGQLTITTSVEIIPDEASPKALPTTYVCLTVKDTGCGIPAEHRDRIFDPFFTTKDIGKGTGLGLATVYGIVKQHDGRITVDSQPGHGAIFRVYFPATANAAVPPPSEVANTNAFHGTETILVVEDEAPVRRLISNILGRYGYTILQAENGPAALALCQSAQPDFQLLITDIIMPGGMNGHELAKHILQMKPHTKVLYTSGYSADVAGDDFQLHEGINFIPKPFTTRRLGQIVRDCLDRDLIEPHSGCTAGT